MEGLKGHLHMRKKMAGKIHEQLTEHEKRIFFFKVWEESRWISSNLACYFWRQKRPVLNWILPFVYFSRLNKTDEVSLNAILFSLIGEM